MFDSVLNLPLYYAYHISFNNSPRHLFNSEALHCAAYWRAALNRGRRFMTFSLSKLEQTTIIILYSLYICPEVLVIYIIFLFACLFHMHFTLVKVKQLDYGQISNKQRILRRSVY